VSKLDKIPAEDEKSVIEDMGYSFQILSVARKKIQRARIRKLLENTAPAVPEEK
jgi:CBS domain containing-hemolysin-like protein